MFKLKELPYNKNFLEPFISENTLNFHYSKHHQSYCDNLNNLIKNTEFESNKTLEEIILSTYQNQEFTAIYNNAAQVWNHTFYWDSLNKNTSYEKDLSSNLKQKIEEKYKSKEIFLETLKSMALSQFGSGWGWVVFNEKDDEIDIIKTSNALNPLNFGLIPLLVVDVWEHAYYLDYQNLRAKYLDNIIQNLLNWKFLNENYEKCRK